MKKANTNTKKSKINLLKDILLDGFNMNTEQKDNFRLAVDDIGREVNRMDKAFGVKLRHPDKSKTPKGVYKSTCKDVNAHLSRTMILLNGLNPDDYSKKNKNKNSLFYPYMVDKDEIVRTDKLRFYRDMVDDHVYDLDTDIFKCRFLMHIVMNYKKSMKDIVKNVTDCRRELTGDKNPEKYVDRYFQLKTLVEDVDKFVCLFLKKDKYGNTLQRMQQYCMFSDPSKYDGHKVNKKIKEATSSLKSSLYETKGSPRVVPDDLCIDTLAKTAFMCATGKSNLRNLINFEVIEDWTIDNPRMKDFVRYIGMCIRKANDDNVNNAPFMFRAFVTANPTIFVSKFANCRLDRDTDLLLGIQAFSYVAFLCNDEHVTKFVNSIF